MAAQSTPTLLRRLGTFDASLIVIGGIIGAGIYMNPSVVARQVPTAPLVMLVWIAGGAIALLGAGIFAELAARRPKDGGLYAYVRDAFHPSVAFMYGWTLLLVSQSGGIALGAITFAVYVEPLTGLHVPSAWIAVAAIAMLTGINVLGVRTGASTQNLLMIVTMTAIVVFIAVALRMPPAAAVPVAEPPFTGGLLAAIGLAMIPVLFAYDGWQSASFVSAELKQPERTLSRGMIFGVLAVVILYVGVNGAFLRVLGVSGLAGTSTPASALAQLAFGPIGLRIVAVVVALSTLGFVSNCILVSPRIYFQMASDGAFFKQFGNVSARTGAPTFSLVLQSVVAAVIALSGTYDQILNYVTSIDYVFIGLGALALIIFRRRDASDPAAPRPSFQLPGHPWSTVIFFVTAWGIVVDVLIKSPVDTSIGFAILLSGLPVYALFRRRSRTRAVPRPQPVAAE